MAFVRLMFKASKINKLKTQLEEEKQKSIEISKNKNAKYTLKQKYRHFWYNVLHCIPNCFGKHCTCPKNTCVYRTLYKAKRDGTCENFTLKSVIGFIGGFFLTYIFFMFFVFQLNFKLSTATIMCSIFGSVLTIGLAFSFKVRCVVFLLLPEFFSKRGRQALIAYAFILAITGPAKNILHNVGILSESMACGQEQLKFAVRQILDVIKKPFYAIRDAIKSIVKTVKEVVKKLKEVLLTIKRIIMGIIKVIKAAFQFLGKMFNVCNKELGTPFERCTRVFEDAIVDCNAKLGPLFNWLCSITTIVQGTCYIVKIFDFICMLVDYISDSVVGIVIRKVKIFVRHIRTMFYVRIKFSHSFHFETNQSKPINEITTGIVTEIRHRTERLLTVFDIMSCATSLFFLFIILRALHYRFKFLTIDRFDNRYITKPFREIDIRRAQLEKETILPLNHRERGLYISINSVRLVKDERVKLSKATVMIGTTTLKLFSHMMIDYALYWVMMVIRYHSAYQTTVPVPTAVQINIAGEGFIASILKSVVKAFQPLGVELEMDTVPCLPDPIPPDYDRYVQIATLLLLCWILTIFEPYGLRLRHSIMCYYHPTRARQRSIWLYNHILRSRSSFLKFARRQLRRKFSKSTKITNITFLEYLRANIRPRFLVMCLDSENQVACMLCGEVFRESDVVKPIHCANPNCNGTYCEQCFSDLQNMCTICKAPIDYGDMSDISVEKDSSDDEQPAKKKKRSKNWYLSNCCKKNRRDRDDDSDDDDDTKPIYPSDSDDTDKPDSYYYSSDTSSSNSYSYQYKKDYTILHQTDNALGSTLTHFRDVERQEIRDEASWSTFNRDTEESSVDPETTSTDSSLISEIELNNFELASRKDKKTQTRRYSHHVAFAHTMVQTELPTSSSSSQSARSTSHTGYSSATTSSKSKDQETSSEASNSGASTSETSFIETPTEKTSKKSKKYINRRETRVVNSLRLPSLNFSSSENTTPRLPDLLSVLNRFNKNVRYDFVQETSRSAITPKSVPKSPLRIGYEIYVPHYDKFVDRSQLMNIKRVTGEEENKSIFERKAEEYKHLQRKGRLDYIQNRNSLSKANASFQKNKSLELKESQNTSSYALRAKDYYKVINKKQSLEEVPILKEKNRFIRMMKHLFLKEKIELPQPRIAFSSHDYVNFTPKSSDPECSATNQTSTSTNSGSLKHTTTSSTSSLMGSTLTINHQRGGADVALKNPKLSILNSNSPRNPDYDSSDSDITDVSVFFGSSVPEKFKRTKVSKDNTASRNSQSIINKSTLKESTTTTNSSFEEELIPRYSRQPAERDENPQNESELTTKMYSNSVSSPNNSDFNITMANEMNTNYSNNSHLSSPCIQKLKNQYRSHSNESEHEQESQHQRTPRSSQENTSHLSSPCINKFRNQYRSHSNQAEREYENSLRCHSRQYQRTPRSCQENRHSSRDQRHCEYHNIHSYPQCASVTTSTQAIPEYCSCKRSSPRTSKISPTSSDYDDAEMPNVINQCNHRRSCGTSSVNEDGRSSLRHKKDCPCNRLEVTVPAQQTEEGVCSDGSGSDFPHLVYQNTDEFLDLVNELGDTLCLRNKQRVQKAIREFEVNSRQNKNLDKPVFEDDSDESVDNCISKETTCCNCMKKKHVAPQQCPTKFTRISTRKESLGKGVPFVHCCQDEAPYFKYTSLNEPMYPKYQQNISSTHWELDPRTGEWFKVYNDYSYEDDFYLNLPVPTPPIREFCSCERNAKRVSARNSPEKHFRSNSVLPSTCKCKNCGSARKRESRY